MRTHLTGHSLSDLQVPLFQFPHCAAAGAKRNQRPTQDARLQAAEHGRPALTNFKGAFA